MTECTRPSVRKRLQPLPSCAFPGGVSKDRNRGRTAAGPKPKCPGFRGRGSRRAAASASLGQSLGHEDDPWSFTHSTRSLSRYPRRGEDPRCRGDRGRLRNRATATGRNRSRSAIQRPAKLASLAAEGVVCRIGGPASLQSAHPAAPDCAGGYHRWSRCSSRPPRRCRCSATPMWFGRTVCPSRDS